MSTGRLVSVQLVVPRSTNKGIEPQTPSSIKSVGGPESPSTSTPPKKLGSPLNLITHSASLLKNPSSVDGNTMFVISIVTSLVVPAIQGIKVAAETA